MPHGKQAKMLTPKQETAVPDVSPDDALSGPDRVMFLLREISEAGNPLLAVTRL